MPDQAMWEKVRKKYKNATRIVLTWNPQKGAGQQLDWPWNQIEPPLYTIKWTVIGAKDWYELDVEKDALQKRNYAASFCRKKKRGKARTGNKRAAVDPRKL